MLPLQVTVAQKSFQENGSFISTPKATVKTAADNILSFFFLYYWYFSEKIRCDISCESFGRQKIHIKSQA